MLFLAYSLLLKLLKIWYNKKVLFRVFPRPFRTLKGEAVYSEGEKKIANYLYSSGIRYRYEPTIRLGRRFYRPDFYLPDYHLYIEYLGMIADPEYAYKTQLKKIAYHNHHLDVAYIVPQHLDLLGTMINQWVEYKSKKKETQYIRLCKSYVPQPIARKWVRSQKATSRSRRFGFVYRIRLFLRSKPI